MNRLLHIAIAIICCGVCAMAYEPADTCDCRHESALPWHTRAEGMGRARIWTSLGIKVGLKLGLTPALKHWIREERPDGSEFNSFPSRHATWAYGIAGTLTYQLGPSSPWWAVGSQTVANAVGFQRILARRHYPHDIMGGIGVGLGTDLIGKVVSNWIFGRYDFFPCWRECSNEYLPNVSVTTGMSFPLQRNFGNYLIQNTLETTMRFSLPLSPKLGFTASTMVNSGFLEEPSGYLQPMTGVAIMVGGTCHNMLAEGTFAVSAIAEVGYRFGTHPHGVPVTQSSSPMVHIAFQSSVMLTRKLSLGLEAGMTAYKLGIENDSRLSTPISVAFFTKANF